MMKNDMKIFDKFLVLEKSETISPKLSYFGICSTVIKIKSLKPVLNNEESFYLHIYDTHYGNESQIKKYFKDIMTYLGVEWQDIFNYIIEKNKQL